MALNEGLPVGATPVDGEELEGLLPSHLVNRNQLNEWEQQNWASPVFVDSGLSSFLVDHTVF